MENIFAKRRARLLAMKAMRENYVPGEKLVTCPPLRRGEPAQGRGGGAVRLPPVRLPLPHGGPITGSAACWTPAPSGSCMKS